MAKVDDTQNVEGKEEQKSKSYFIADFEEIGSATFIPHRHEVTTGQLAALMTYLQNVVQTEWTQEMIMKLQAAAAKGGGRKDGPPKIWKPGMK